MTASSTPEEIVGVVEATITGFMTLLGNFFEVLHVTRARYRYVCLPIAAVLLGFVAEAKRWGNMSDDDAHNWNEYIEISLVSVPMPPEY